MLFFLKNDTITEILNLKNYFYFPLCGVSSSLLNQFQNRKRKEKIFSVYTGIDAKFRGESFYSNPT